MDKLKKLYNEMLKGGCDSHTEGTQKKPVPVYSIKKVLSIRPEISHFYSEILSIVFGKHDLYNTGNFKINLFDEERKTNLKRFDPTKSIVLEELLKEVPISSLASKKELFLAYKKMGKKLPKVQKKLKKQGVNLAYELKLVNLYT